ncbi:DUF416 family protein [Brevifollis gellanilyticus]|uniref:Uncharacterized protein n=1 Tax=Brevifollis gellanilyticus TaxID=748831 RepID=A0A512MHX1_9BACT|nr:DUF416 family protein [Brevifollis gellanilyticus]GEP46333.1 hypothetical protein BGE01nite_56240 [Brevifollis gellanilyticus]
MNVILSHSAFIQISLTGLDSIRAFGWAAAICQRALPCVIRLSEDQLDSSTAACPALWDKVWKSLKGLDEFPDDAPALLERMIPDEAFAAEQNDHFQAIVMLHALAAAIHKHDTSEVAHVSDAALALLDNALHRDLSLTPGKESDLLIGRHPWVTQEIDRQVRDLSIAQQAPEAREAVLQMWRQTVNETLLPCTTQ